MSGEDDVTYEGSVAAFDDVMGKVLNHRDEKNLQSKLWFNKFRLGKIESWAGSVFWHGQTVLGLTKNSSPDTLYELLVAIDYENAPVLDGGKEGWDRLMQESNKLGSVDMFDWCGAGGEDPRPAAGNVIWDDMLMKWRLKAMEPYYSNIRSEDEWCATIQHLVQEYDRSTGPPYGLMARRAALPADACVSVRIRRCNFARQARMAHFRVRADTFCGVPIANTLRWKERQTHVNVWIDWRHGEIWIPFDDEDVHERVFMVGSGIWF